MYPVKLLLFRDSWKQPLYWNFSFETLFTRAATLVTDTLTPRNTSTCNAYFQGRPSRSLSGADLGGWLGWLVIPPGASAYFMLLLCVWLKLFRCRFVPLLEPNKPRPPQCSLASLGFPKSPPLKNPRSATVYIKNSDEFVWTHSSMRDRSLETFCVFTIILL